LQFSYPLRIDNKGRVAVASPGDHIRQLVEQLLFTNQGERVNRPTFGCGINQLVFAPNSDEIAAATQLLIQGSLQQWLADLVNVDSVTVQNNDANLNISITYTVKTTRERKTEDFSMNV
jgi:uncharacterized protein